VDQGFQPRDEYASVPGAAPRRNRKRLLGVGPLFQEPVWLQQLARVTLTAWAMDGIHDLILRERGLLELLPTLGFLVAYGAGSAWLGGRLYRLSD
jgi:hypothetical protein